MTNYDDYDDDDGLDGGEMTHEQMFELADLLARMDVHIEIDEAMTPSELAAHICTGLRTHLATSGEDLPEGWGDDDEEAVEEPQPITMSSRWRGLYEHVMEDNGNVSPLIARDPTLRRATAGLLKRGAADDDARQALARRQRGEDAVRMSLTGRRQPRRPALSPLVEAIPTLRDQVLARVQAEERKRKEAAAKAIKMSVAAAAAEVKTGDATVNYLLHLAERGPAFDPRR